MCAETMTIIPVGDFRATFDDTLWRTRFEQRLEAIEKTLKAMAEKIDQH